MHLLEDLAVDDEPMESLDCSRTINGEVDVLQSWATPSSPTHTNCNSLTYPQGLAHFNASTLATLSHGRALKRYCEIDQLDQSQNDQARARPTAWCGPRTQPCRVLSSPESPYS